MCKDGDVLSLLVLISREASSLSSQQRVRVPTWELPSAGYSVVVLFTFSAADAMRHGPRRTYPGPPGTARDGPRRYTASADSQSRDAVRTGRSEGKWVRNPFERIGWFAPRRFRSLPCKIPGGHRRRVTPVPIPNTEVKPSTADGTAWVTAWESRSLPGVSQGKGPGSFSRTWFFEKVPGPFPFLTYRPLRAS